MADQVNGSPSAAPVDEVTGQPVETKTSASSIDVQPESVAEKVMTLNGEPKADPITISDNEESMVETPSSASKRAHEDSDTGGEEEEPAAKKSRPSEEEPEPAAEESSPSNGDTAAAAATSDTADTPVPAVRKRGRPRREDRKETPKPADDTPRRRGRPRIHPPKEPSAVKRPRGRPPSKATTIARQELVKQITSGESQSISAEDAQKYAVESLKKVDTMKKKIKELESMLEERDEEIFMLRSKLQEMGVDTDSLSMNALQASKRDPGGRGDCMYTNENRDSEHDERSRMTGVIVIQPECP